MALAEGTKIGPYTVSGLIGQGGMGEVYQARDTQLDRDVALKVPRFDVSESRDCIERFYREARAAATIRHPNLCPVYDVGEIDGQHYISMAHIEGRSLADFVQPGKPLSQRKAAIVTRKIVRALEVAHQKGIVHRDLKPSNIMIDERKEPVVVDFGLARRVDSDESRLTAAGAVLGTPAYMPPEQITGDLNQIGPHSDVYSAGVILYELLTGETPFTGPVTVVLAQVLSVEPPPPSSLRPGLDAELEAVCLKAMAKEIADRYRSMKDFAEALSGFLQRESGKSVKSEIAGSVATARAPPSAVRASVPSTVPAAGGTRRSVDPTGQPGVARPPGKQSTRSRTPFVWIAATIGAAAFAIALLLVVVVIVTQNRNDTESRNDTQSRNDPDTSTAGRGDESSAVDVDWQPLFNGQALTGWSPFEIDDKGSRKYSRDAWTVQDGFLLCATDNTSVLVSTKEYGDFELELQFKLPRRSGFFLLFRTDVDAKRGEKPPGIPFLDEFLLNEFINSVKKGKPSEIVAITAITQAMVPAGDWNSLGIRCEGEGSDAQLQLTLNNKTPLFKGPLSQFGLKVRPTGSLILVSPAGMAKGSMFRKIRIRELK
jgi:serine/threonine protein kinase